MLVVRLRSESVNAKFDKGKQDYKNPHTLAHVMENFQAPMWFRCVQNAEKRKRLRRVTRLCRLEGLLLPLLHRIHQQLLLHHHLSPLKSPKTIQSQGLAGQLRGGFRLLSTCNFSGIWQLSVIRRACRWLVYQSTFSQSLTQVLQAFTKRCHLFINFSNTSG